MDSLDPSGPWCRVELGAFVSGGWRISGELIISGGELAGLMLGLGLTYLAAALRRMQQVKDMEKV